jgi:hypothetical protein
MILFHRPKVRAGAYGERKPNMSTEEKSFADLVKEGPAQPAMGTISLIGTLAQSSEAGKFVLILQDGRSVTLEIAAVKGHAVLGASVGQAIVRVDIDAGKIPTISAPWDNSTPLPWLRIAGGVAPFIAAMPHQADPATIATLTQGMPGTAGQFLTFPSLDPHRGGGLHNPDFYTTPSLDVSPTSGSIANLDLPGGSLQWLDKNPFHDHQKSPSADGTIPILYPPYHTSDF